MTNVLFTTPPNFASGRLQKIGFHSHELYVALKLTNTVEIWCVHCFVPSSWRKIYVIHTHELFYCYSTLSISDNCIYVLVLGIMEFNEPGKVIILRINPYVTNGHVSVAYNLNFEHSSLFLQIGLESLGFGCGNKNGLYIYDPSMIMGPIPFWRIRLNDNDATFSIDNHCIIELENNEFFHSSRFPVVIDGDRRLVLKITTENELAIFNENTETWSILSPLDSTDLDLSLIQTRIIRETFGHAWHRCGVIESPLSVFSDEGYCVFKIFHNNMHTFYILDIDESKSTYCLRKCSCTQMEKRLQVRFFMHCDKGRRIAFVNKSLVGFVNIQPPLLKELSFWAFQRMLCRQDKEGFWYDGKSEEQIRQLCHLGSAIKLI